MGRNNAGQLGNGSLIKTNKPVQIVSSNVIALATGGAHSLFLKSNDSLWGMGWNAKPLP